MNCVKIGILALLISMMVGVQSVEIEKGWVVLDVVTGDNKEEHKIEYHKSIKQTLSLTQSSKINIQAKMTFSSDDFVPEFFSFRLRHSQYDNITEPILANWNEDHSDFRAVVDLGDPKQIKHLSGDYKLEIIIGDDRLKTQVRRYFANCKVNFRYSLDAPQTDQLHYVTPSIIMTEAPAERVDPPALFTGFVCVVMVLLFCLFLYGLNHQKANLNLFPGNGMGSILNLVFLGCFVLVFYMLIKFWLSWNFLDTVKYFIIAVLPFSLAANYAFIHIKKN